MTLSESDSSLKASRVSRSYVETVRETWSDVRIWDYLSYDEEGSLWLGKLRVVDAARQYGTPLEIVDTTLVERRAKEWMALAQRVADDTGYPGRLDYLYAGKANLASEVACAAYRSGWGAETSAVQELMHLDWLRQHGLLPEDIRVVCNGFKLPPACLGLPNPGIESEGAVALPPFERSAELRGGTYAERILLMREAGWRIQPILDSGELAAFAGAERPSMDVGLRLKFGPVDSFDDLQHLVSRFGMEPSELHAAAEGVDRAPNLRFTCLHSMVGAAETIPVNQFVNSLSFAGRIWADLKRRHPTLSELNIGGGVPPLSEPYDHEGFLRGLYAGLLAAASEADVPPPDVTFELGSLLAAECGFHVFKVIQSKDDAWAIVDGGLMAAIPDMLFLDKEFRLLAAVGGLAEPRKVILGDVTCDGDGRYPPKAFGDAAAVLLPTASGEQFVVIASVGAYQEILAGVRGAHHCGLLEAPELILERRGGEVKARLMPRQTYREAAEVLGYSEIAVEPLREAL